MSKNSEQKRQEKGEIKWTGRKKRVVCLNSEHKRQEKGEIKRTDRKKYVWLVYIQNRKDRRRKK